jgi:hypothetical protein
MTFDYSARLSCLLALSGVACANAATCPSAGTLPPRPAVQAGVAPCEAIATPIRACDEWSGVLMEHLALRQWFPKSKPVRQQLFFCGPTKRVDMVEIRTAHGNAERVYFDITSFYGVQRAAARPAHDKP